MDSLHYIDVTETGWLLVSKIALANEYKKRHLTVNSVILGCSIRKEFP